MIDFTDKSFLYRYQKQIPKSDLLKKSLGKIKSPTLIDCTAGLGTDAFHFAALGCNVIACEKVNEIYFELNKNWQNFLQNEMGKLNFIKKNLILLNIDSLIYLRELNEKPDVIYIDPMYESGSVQSALPKKDMQFLRKHAESNELETATLFNCAIQNAKRRVLVKRALHAQSISGIKPSHQIKGRSVRYDVYVLDGH